MTDDAIGHGHAAPARPLLPEQPLLRAVARLLGVINRAMLALSMLALLATALVLTWSVITRYVLHQATDWQDEASVFMLVGATFMCTAYVQSFRGHVGIEALAGLLPARVNRARLLLVDLVSFLFCLFFSWKSWTLCHEAWSEGQTTATSWAPSLAIPYALMALGMSLLTLQLLVQTGARLTDRHQDGRQ